MIPSGLDLELFHNLRQRVDHSLFYVEKIIGTLRNSCMRQLIVELTESCSNSLTACGEVQCFSDGEFALMQVHLAHVNRSFLCNELMELVAVVGNFAHHLS